MPLEDRKKFFFAEAEAGLYDVSVELTTPLYRLMQETLLQLASEHLKSKADQKEILVLDIGSGTGEESIPLLKTFPAVKVVAVDLSTPMHEQYKKRLVEQGLSADRVRFVTGDIVGRDCTTDTLRSVLSDFADSESYDLAISALAIHHLSSTEKREAYRRIGDLLEPGSLFLNADFFTYEAKSLARQAHEYGCDWLYRQFTNPDDEYREVQSQLGDRAAALRDAWLDHYKNDNLPDPVYGESDKSQASMLRETGFSQIECPFMFWELGIIWALKQ